MWSNIKIVQLDITIVIDIYWLKLLIRHRYKHDFITLLDLLSYCITMYQRANVCQCLQLIAVLIYIYISFISYIDSTVLNTSNITIQYNNTIKQNHIQSFGT